MGLLLRCASVALLGQTFFFPNSRMRWRAGFVRIGEIFATTPIRL